MTDLRADWNFHVWERDPATGKPKKWVGQFYSDRDALTWRRRQENGAERFIINTIAPSVKDHRASSLPPEAKDFPIKVVPTKPMLSDAEKQARYERIRNGEIERVNRPTTGGGRVLPAVHHAPPAPFSGSGRVPAKKAAPPVPKAPDTPEMKKAKKEAEKVLAQHKADEQADIDAGVDK